MRELEKCGGSLSLQVLTALDRAHRELGFVHGDMRIANIMEHRPEGGGEVLPHGFRAETGGRGAWKPRADLAGAQGRRESGASELTSVNEFQLPGEGECVT